MEFRSNVLTYVGEYYQNSLNIDLPVVVLQQKSKKSVCLLVGFDSQMYPRML